MKWNNFKFKKPNQGENILVAHRTYKNFEIIIGQYYEMNGKDKLHIFSPRCFTDGVYIHFKPLDLSSSFWMPLPENPNRQNTILKKDMYKNKSNYIEDEEDWEDGIEESEDEMD